MTYSVQTPCKDIAVFIGSCDRTRDVFLQVSKTISSHWHDCPYMKYVGLNTAAAELDDSGFTPVLASIDTWSRELHEQIKQCKENYILLMLDDFAVTDVDQEKINFFMRIVKKNDLQYLRLIPIQRSLVARILAHLSALMTGQNILEIPGGIPYYSSLQVAIWNRRHLLRMLEMAIDKNIWEFEHLKFDGIKHYAIVGRPPISYMHLVEKGCWLPNADKVLRASNICFMPGRRKVLPRSYKLKMIKDRFVFALIGYAWVRSKKILAKNSTVQLKLSD